MSREELIVEFGVACWINSTEVLHPAILIDCLSDHVSELKLRTRLEHISDLKVFRFELFNQLVDEEVNLRVYHEVWNEQIICTGLRDWDRTCECVVIHVRLGLASCRA